MALPDGWICRPPAPNSCRATFEHVQTFPLTVTIEGPGTVTSDPAGIHCTRDSTCTQDFPASSRIKLTPQPDPDALFIGWKQLQPSTTNSADNCARGFSDTAEPFIFEALHCHAEFRPIRTPTQVWQHAAPPPAPISTLWKPDGTQIAVSNTSIVRFFGTDTGEFIGRINRSNPSNSEDPFVWNPQGTSIATTFDFLWPHNNTAEYGIRVYDAVPNAPYTPIPTSQKVTSLTWDPTGTTFAIGAENGSIQIVDSTTHALINEWSAHDATVTELSWSPNGQYLVTSSLSENTRIWSTTAWILEHEFTGSGWNSLIWNHNATKTAGIADGQIHIATPANTPANIQLTSWPATACESISFNPASTKLVATCDGQWTIWDIATQSRLFTAPALVPATNTVQTAQWNPVHDKILAQYDDDSIRIFDGANYQLLLLLNGTNDAINTLVHNPLTNILYAASHDGLIYGLDGSTGTFQTNFNIPRHPQSIPNSFANHSDSIALSLVNDSVLSYRDGYIQEWSAQTGLSLPPWHAGSRATQTQLQIAISDDDILATALGWTDGIRLWPTRGQPHAQTLTSLQNFPSIAWQPGGKILASSAANTTHLWNTETGLIERTLECPPLQSALDVAFSSDGQLIAIPCSRSFSSPADIGIWSVTTGDLLYSLPSAPVPPRIAWRPGTKLIAIGMRQNNNIEIVDVTTGNPFLAPGLESAFMGVTSMTWSADGKRLFLGHNNGTITAYDIPF